MTLRMLTERVKKLMDSAPPSAEICLAMQKNSKIDAEEVLNTLVKKKLLDHATQRDLDRKRYSSSAPDWELKFTGVLGHGAISHSHSEEEPSGIRVGEGPQGLPPGWRDEGADKRVNSTSGTSNSLPRGGHVKSEQSSHLEKVDGN